MAGEVMLYASRWPPFDHDEFNRRQVRYMEWIGLEAMQSAYRRQNRFRPKEKLANVSLSDPCREI